MADNFHNKPFDEATKLKLEIFGECFREWLPVFIFNPTISKIFIYDYFAGSGKDIIGFPGSPLILLNEAKGENCSVCKSLNGKEIIFAFNDKNKSQELEISVKEYLDNCIKDNCKKEKCQYSWHIGNYEFREAFERENVKKILKDKNYAKFIILDQFGFSQVDENVFRELTNAPKTDFIFFIASSFIDRFKNHEYTKKYFDTSKIDFESKQPIERHELIANYFERLVDKIEYYVHHFTIKKGSNYYGLIFGTSHTYGMEKFLKICWKKDEFSGEANDNKYLDYNKGTLFYNPHESNKLNNVREEIISKVLSGEIKDNITGLKYALKKRCLPELFTKTIKELEKDGRIIRQGDVNNRSTNIHNIPLYSILIKSDESIKNRMD